MVTLGPCKYTTPRKNSQDRKGQAPQQTKKATKTETVTPTKAAPKKMGFDILGDE